MKKNSQTKAASIPCPSCDEGVLIATHRDFQTEAEGKDITIPHVAMEQCSICDETMLTPEGSKQVSEHIESVTNSLGKDELLYFLNKYKLTHKDAAEILGIGEKNFSRWINGRQRVSTSMSNYIRTLTAIPAAFEALQKRQWVRPTPSTQIS